MGNILCQFYVFVCIAEGGKVGFEGFPSDDYRASAVVGMEGECGGIEEYGIEKEVDVVLQVIDKSEGRYTAWFESEIAHHTLWRCEGEFAGCRLALADENFLQSVLKVVDVEVVVAVKADEIVAVAFVVAKEDVLAVDASIVLPPAFGFLNGLAFGVMVDGVRYGVSIKIVEYDLFTGLRKCIYHLLFTIYYFYLLFKI